MARSPEAASWAAGGRRGSPRRAAGLALASLLALLGIAGAGMLVAAFTVGAEHPPQPAAQAAPHEEAPHEEQRAATAERPAPDPTVVGMSRSAPTRLAIPRIGVDTSLLQMGVNADGSVQVPDARKQAKQAGWYKLGPSPGEVGNAVIVGHVNTKEQGPVVFYKLGALKPGDRIVVTRADRKQVTFVVDGVKAYPKTAFPTDLVYGASDRVGLRLVTCGGEFDKKKRSYQDNVVVFATAAVP
ncbi:class F sortase [Plantactinospora sp. GCM10030261]|uniref:class F sortase n=1 Tax=Plantactinospora sp. GCM10030261 TaxID=3273420 RepID=UPI003616537D